jgi:hypothetical protein
VATCAPLDVADGHYHSCAIATFGVVKCWGMNTDG